MERKGKGTLGTPKDRDKLKKGGMLLMGRKRGGPSTPSPTWRLEFSSVSPNFEKNNIHPVQVLLRSNSRVTARKLCANLWEVQPQLHGISDKFNGTGKRGARVSCGRQGLTQDSDLKLKGRLVDLPCSSSRPDQPPGVGMSGKQFGTPLVQDHPSIERGHPSVLSSPTGHSSSLEVAPCNHAIIPTSSLDFKGKRVEPSNKFKISTELLKVLNKIWSLEEQKAFNISLQKSLKLEIEDSHLKIKRLLKERKKNQREMDILRKEAVKDKAYVNRELDCVEAAVQSAQQALMEERKLRKQSETLHRKLAHEVSEVQSSLFLAIKEVEQERRDRLMLENLCDEFAQEIRDYEHEVWSLRRKAEIDHSGVEIPDRLVLHISDAWLDGRMQMELAEAQCRLAEKDKIAHKLRLDIETFLQARCSSGLRKGKGLPSYITHNCCRRESFPLRGSSSAPKDTTYEGNSSDSDLHCFELTKSASKGHNILIRSEELNSRLHLSNIREQLGQSMISKERNQFPGGEKGGLRLKNQTEAGNMGIADICKARQEGFDEKNGKWLGNHSPYSDFILNDRARIYSMSSEGDKICPVSDIKEESYVLPVSEGHASPIKQWMSKLTPPEFDKVESSSKLHSNVKENTLKAKLLEARLEDQRSRLKADKAPS